LKEPPLFGFVRIKVHALFSISDYFEIIKLTDLYIEERRGKNKICKAERNLLV